MDVVIKIWGFIRSAWEWLDGNKTDIGLKIGGIVLAVVNFENFLNFHPEFLTPILDFLTSVATWMTGGGLAHKAFKAGMAASQKAKIQPVDPTPPAAPPK